jgi:alpha-beta hydrolase superfamily lysophospholipase
VRSAPFAFRASDGARLHVERWLPDSAPRGWLQIVHGMGEHVARYAGLAERACAVGLAVVGHDLRGHGRTAGADGLGDLGPGGWDASVRDLVELGESLAAEAPGIPRVLLGHSMGSLLVRASFARSGRSAAGIALSASSDVSAASAAALQSLAALESLRLGPAGRSALLRWLIFGRAERSFPTARTRFAWLSRDPSEVAAYAADPACGFVLRAGSLHQMFGGIRRLERGEASGVPRDLPILLFAGGDDPLSGARAIEAIAGRSARSRPGSSRGPGTSP